MANIKGGLINKTNNMAKQQQPKTIQSLIISMEKQIAKALPKVLTPERFTRMVLTALSKDNKLASCTPNSFLGAMMQAAQLGLEPNTPLGQAYLIPFKNKGVLEVQFQIGYKGMIDLAYRSKEVTDISAQCVYENDEFEYELGLSPVLKHKPALSNRGEVILYYAVFHTKSGGYGFEVMSKEDIINHAKKTSQSFGSSYSPSFGSSYSPWNKYFDEMAKKTVLKRVLKYAPIASDFAMAINSDETIKSNISANMVDEEDETMVDITPEENEEIQEDEKVVDKETGEILQQPSLQPEN